MVLWSAAHFPQTPSLLEIWREWGDDVRGETIVVHSADPVAATRRKTENTLPPNLRQCPYCSFITQYEEEYTVHVRAHLFGI